MLAAEAAAVDARQGKLRDELYALSLTSSAETVPVWIWADVRETPPPKERMIADVAFRKAYESRRLADVRAKTGPIAKWLDERGFVARERGDAIPLVTADVPATALASLGRLPGVAIAGFREDGAPTGTSWFDTVKGTAAQIIVGTAGTQSFCNSEGDQPDSYSFLSVPAAQLLASSGTSMSHTRWTTELISAPSGLRMAPSAPTYIPNWTGTATTPPGAWQWCWNQGANAMNRSWISHGGLAAGLLDATDMTTDYYVKVYPYPLITNEGGNCNNGNPLNLVDCSTRPSNRSMGSRGYNYLIVGASDDKDTTFTSDDTIAPWSAWQNPTTIHADFELPHMVAPGVHVSSASYANGDGTSASAPITLGAALLARTRDTTYAPWPEMMRATVLATSTYYVEPSRTLKLSAGGADIKQGAGLLNTNALVDVASSSYYKLPGVPASPKGHYGKTYYFSTDFTNLPYSNDTYAISTTTAGRLRVALAWDSTAAGCSTTDGSNCTGDTIDADLDLVLYKQVSGQWQYVCGSNSYDSSWEVCDIGVLAGETYRAQLVLGTAYTASTYVGIAWYNYSLTSE